MSTFCGWCGEQQLSELDKQYLACFGRCWSEDKERWKDGKMSKEEFEKREKEALESIQ